MPLGAASAPATTSAEVPPGPTEDQAAAKDRPTEARLARVHLRGGLLPLARAALEQMAGAGTLDRDAMADLAEVRWRSGDVEGATDAARAHTASGGAEPLALLIIAEDLARVGRQAEARDFAKAVFERVGGSVEPFFAAEPRSELWPPADDGWMPRDASAPGRWGLLVGGSEVAAPTPKTWQVEPIAEPPAAVAMAAPGAAVQAPMGRGGVVQPGGQASTSAVLLSGRLAGEELETVDHSIATGDTDGAAHRLAVLLRLDPALAPVILTAADKAVAAAPSDSATCAAIHLVRGDAYRTLGRDNEAAAAYQQAHQALASGSPPKEPT